MLPPVSLLWINYNSIHTSDVTKKSLDAVMQLDYPKLEIIIVDNGSTDGSADLIEKYLSEHKTNLRATLRFLRIKKNRGWTVAVNVAYDRRNRNSKYLALTHSDVIPTSHYLKGLITFLESHKDVGAAQGVVVKLGDESVVDSSGFMMNEGLFVSSSYTEGSVQNFVKPLYISMIEGTMPIYNLGAIRDILPNEHELFIPEGYMYYLEDAFISLKLWANGYKCAVIPIIAGLHRRMGTTTKTVKSGDRFYYLLRNRVALLWMTNSSGKLGFITQNMRKLVVSNRTTAERKAILVALLEGIHLGWRLKRKYGSINFYAAPFIRPSLKARLFKWMH